MFDSGKRGFAIAALSVAACSSAPMGSEPPGDAGSAGDDPGIVTSTGGGGQPAGASLVTGRWGMLGWEDPVGVRLFQHGELVRGTGCSIGAPGVASGTVRDISAYCGDLSGSLRPEGMQFSFFQYFADRILISEDGARMTGAFAGITRPSGSPIYMTWLRVADDAVWLTPPALSDVEKLRLNMTPQRDLALLDQTGQGQAYLPGVRYRFGLDSVAGVYGDLGHFGLNELVLSTLLEDTIRVGPVSYTRAELPVELEIRFERDDLSEVRAKMHSGDVYRFGVFDAG